MASSYPSTFDAFTNPTASDKTNSATVPHATQHANANDAIEALQRKVGLSTSGSSGSSSPSTRLGDSLAVNSTGGHTAWGTWHPVRIAEHTTTSTGTAAIDFENIPEHFSGLMVQFKAKSASTALTDNVAVQMGSTGAAVDTSSNYDYSFFHAVGANSTAFQTTNNFIASGVIPGSTGPASLYCRAVGWLYDYRSTDSRKAMTGTYFSEDVGTSSSLRRTGIIAGQWNSTAPVGKLRFSMTSGGNFGTGSKIGLYGLP